VETIMITKMTGQTGFAMLSGALGADALRSGVLVSSGLGLGISGLSVATPCTVSGLGNAEGTRVETGLSRGWVIFGGGISPRDERPTQAPKAVAAAAKHGHYAAVVGAGAEKQQDQQINQARAAFTAATAIRMRAFRGPEPWSERT